MACATARTVLVLHSKLDDLELQLPDRRQDGVLHVLISAVQHLRVTPGVASGDTG
jgi:hypothetical protein